MVDRLGGYQENPRGQLNETKIHIDFISVSPNFKDNDKVIFNSGIPSQTSHQLINIS